MDNYSSDIDGIISELYSVNNDINKNIIANLESRWISKESDVFIEKLHDTCWCIKNIALMLNDLKDVYKVDYEDEILDDDN